jgi:hypothetical protein
MKWFFRLIGSETSIPTATTPITPAKTIQAAATVASSPSKDSPERSPLQPAVERTKAASGDTRRRELPPPAPPSLPSPRAPIRAKQSPPVTKETCPVDGATLAPLSGDDRRCRVCRGVLLSPSSFHAELERLGVEREIVKGLAELHPITKRCSACALSLSAPRLRDVVPLVCVGCDAAFFREGDLEIFRGERPSRPRSTRAFTDRSGRWSDDWMSLNHWLPSDGGWSDSGSDGRDGDGGDGDGGDGGGGDGGGGDGGD